MKVQTYLTCASLSSEPSCAHMVTKHSSLYKNKRRIFRRKPSIGELYRVSAVVNVFDWRNVWYSTSWQVLSSKLNVEGSLEYGHSSWSHFGQYVPPRSRPYPPFLGVRGDQIDSRDKKQSSIRNERQIGTREPA